MSSQTNPELEEIVIVPKRILFKAKALVTTNEPEKALDLLRRNIVLGSRIDSTTCERNINRLANTREQVIPRQSRFGSAPKGKRQTKKHWEFEEM